jgi:cell division transport system ATP-binding protein
MSRKPGAALAEDDGPNSPLSTVVRFDGVSMRYGSGAPILDDISFGLAPGSFHFLTGASGSGKTTVLRLIYLAEFATAGRIEVLGNDVANLRRRERAFLRRRVGVVFQEFRLLDHLSAFDNAALGPRIAGRKPVTYRADVAELLSWVGLRDRIHVMPDALSGGEKQRLAIARAVVNRPDILLADEPTGNVDAAIALRILRLFTELNRVGTTVLVASHDEDLVARAGKPVLHLKDGRLTRASSASSGAGL